MILYFDNNKWQWIQLTIFRISNSERKIKQLTYKYLFLVQMHIFWNSNGIEKCWTKSSIVFALSRKGLFFSMEARQFGVLCSFLVNHLVHYKVWTIWNYQFGLYCSILGNPLVHYKVWIIWSYDMDQTFHIRIPKLFIDHSYESDPDSWFHSFLWLENNIIKVDRRE